MHSLWATIKRFKQNQDKNDSVLKVFVILIYLIRYHCSQTSHPGVINYINLLSNTSFVPYQGKCEEVRNS